MKIQKYTNIVTSFVNHSFNQIDLTQLTDKELGIRVKPVGYSYSDIIRNLTNVYLSDGDVVDDIIHKITIYFQAMDYKNIN